MAQDYEKMSSVEFGMSLLGQQQKTFEQERKRKEKQDRKMALAKLVTSGLSSMVKEKFNAFEQKENYKKIKLNDILNGQQGYNEYNKIITDNYGGDSLAFWENFYRTNLTAQMGEGGIYSNYQLTGPAQAYIYKEARRLATNKNQQWLQLQKEYADVPQTQAELDKRWDEYVSSRTPTNLFNFGMRGLKNLFSGKTREDIEAEGQAEFDERFKEFKELEVAQQGFKKYQNSENFITMFDKLKEAYEAEGNEIGFMALKEGNPTIKSFIERTEDGYVTKDYLVTQQLNDKGQIQIRKSELGITNFQQKEKPEYKDEDYKRVNDATLNYINTENPDLDAVLDEMRVGKDNQISRNFSVEVLEVSEFYKNIKGISNGQAEYLAVQDVLINKAKNGAASRLDANTLTSFDLSKKANQERNVSVSLINEYLKDLPEYLQEVNKLPYNNELKKEEMKNFYQGLLEDKDLNLNEDQKLEYQNQINSMFHPDVDIEKLTPVSSGKEQVVVERFGIPEDEKEVENIYESIVKKGATGIKYVDFFEYIPKMDLSKLSGEELDALYNISKRGIRGNLNIPEDIDFARTAIERNTFREAIEDELKKREKEEGVSYITSTYYGEKRKRGSLITSENVKDNFWSPLAQLILNAAKG